MAKEPDQKYFKMKVLTSEKAGSYEWEGKTVQLHKVVLQGVEKQDVIVTGEAKEPLPEAVLKKEIVPEVWVYKNTYQGEDQIRLFFPTPKGEGKSGGKSWQGGKQEDVELKLVSFSMSYAKDLYMNTPEATLDGMFETADKIFNKMWAMYKAAKG